MARPLCSKLYRVSDNDFREFVKTSSSYADVLRKCKLQYKGGNINTVKRRINSMGLSDDHIPKGIGSNNHRKFEYCRITLDDAIRTKFVRDSDERTYSIRRLILRFGLVPYKCSCGNVGTWNGCELVLQLDHIDGDTSNNTLENLRFLCPNCHSQTPTFSGRNSIGKHNRNGRVAQ